MADTKDDSPTDAQRFRYQVMAIALTVISPYLYTPIITGLCLVVFHLFHTYVWAQVPGDSHLIIYFTMALGELAIIVALSAAWFFSVVNISNRVMFPNEIGIYAVRYAVIDTTIAAILLYIGLFWVPGYWKAIPFLLALVPLCLRAFRLSWQMIEFYLDLGKKRAARQAASGAPAT